MVERRDGYSYSVSPDQIDRYRLWPLERRLKWLFYGNKLRKCLPSKTIEIQESFRKGNPCLKRSDPQRRSPVLTPNTAEGPTQ
jgi:hypothetical protein